MSQMIEIRWHGRAGQGVVTAGELLGEAAMEEGKYFQAFPEYGAERMGAPIKAYTRISDEPIEIHCPDPRAGHRGRRQPQPDRRRRPDRGAQARRHSHHQHARRRLPRSASA